jgi:glutathione peroxidase
MRWCLCKDKKSSAAICGAALIPMFAYAANQNQHHEESQVVAQEQIEPEAEKKPVSKYVLNYTMDSIDGKPTKLESYKGKVVLMVNVASKCGLTPQYEGLQELYDKYEKQGFVVIGFPANNFAGQEPGTDKEIQQFCSTNYGVTFPMMSKISVKGKDAHPLYAQLAAQPEPVGGEPEWNFDKFLVNRDGEVVARFKPRTTPEAPELRERIEQLLEED